jgi:hypothetical protein
MTVDAHNGGLGAQNAAVDGQYASDRRDQSKGSDPNPHLSEKADPDMHQYPVPCRPAKMHILICVEISSQYQCTIYLFALYSLV